MGFFFTMTLKLRKHLPVIPTDDGLRPTGQPFHD